MILLCSVLLAGCSAASPRFTSSTRSQVQDRPAAVTVPPAAADTDSVSVSEEVRDTAEAPVDMRKLTGADSSPDDNPSIDRHKVLGQIMAHMGTPYAKRGSDSLGMDCSGFTSAIYRDGLGVSLPRSSREQYGTGTKIGRDALRFGDLVFFRTSGKRPSHVGIYIGDGLFAHSSVSLGVTVSLLASSYYARRYLGARRILE